VIFFFSGIRLGWSGSGARLKHGSQGACVSLILVMKFRAGSDEGWDKQLYTLLRLFFLIRTD